MNYQIQICLQCDKIYINNPECDHNCLLINCTKEELEKYKEIDKVKQKMKRKE